MSGGWRGWSGTARAVRGSEVAEERSAGLIAGPASSACSPRTRFQAGSISKLVLSVVVLELAGRQQLDLHGPIERWLGQAPREWRKITLHQLLSHSSGLGHWGDVPGLPPVLSTPPPRDELEQLIAAAPLSYPPGSGWRYSGPGFVLAALVVEAATLRPYSDLAREFVVQPAGLQETTVGLCPVGGPEVATGHHEGQPIDVHPQFAAIPGTGDLWTTTTDLVRLSQALRAGRLLEPALAAQLWTPHVILEPASDDTPLSMWAYGYGTFLGRVKGQEARINPGDNPGYQSLLAYLPERDLDLAVLCNEDPPSATEALSELTLG